MKITGVILFLSLMSMTVVQGMARKKAEVLANQLDRLISVYEKSGNSADLSLIESKMSELKKMSVPLAKQKVSEFETEIKEIKSNIEKQTPTQQSSETVPPPPTDIVPSPEEVQLAQSAQIIDFIKNTQEKITKLEESFSAYQQAQQKVDPQDPVSSFTILESIDLKNQFQQLQTIKTTIDEQSELSEEQKKSLTDQVEKIATLIAKWQMIFAAKALELAQGRIETEVQTPFDKQKDMEKLAAHFKDIIDKLVFNFTKINILSLVKDATELQSISKLSKAEKQLDNLGVELQSEYNALRIEADNLRRRLFLFWTIVEQKFEDQNNMIATGKKGEFQDVQLFYQIGLTVAQAIASYEKYFEPYFMNLKKIGSHPFEDEQLYVTTFTVLLQESKIADYRKKLSGYDKEKDLDAIDLSKHFDAVTQFKKDVAEQKNLTEKQIEKLNRSVQLLESDIAKWQMYFAAQALKIGSEKIVSQVREPMKERKNLDTLAATLNELVAYFALNLAYKKFMSANTLQAQSVSEENIGLANLQKAKETLQKNFSALEKEIKTFAQRLFYLQKVLYEELQEIGTEIVQKKISTTQLELMNEKLPAILEATGSVIDVYVQTYKPFLNTETIDGYKQNVSEAYAKFEQIKEKISSTSAERTLQTPPAPIDIPLPPAPTDIVPAPVIEKEPTQSATIPVAPPLTATKKESKPVPVENETPSGIWKELTEKIEPIKERLEKETNK